MRLVRPTASRGISARPVVDDLQQVPVEAEGDAAAASGVPIGDAAGRDANAADRIDQPFNLDRADVAEAGAGC